MMSLGEIRPRVFEVPWSLWNAANWRLWRVLTARAGLSGIEEVERMSREHLAVACIDAEHYGGSRLPPPRQARGRRI